MKNVVFSPHIGKDITIVEYGDAYDDHNKFDKKFKITFKDGRHFLFSRTTRMYFYTGFSARHVENCRLFATALFKEDYETVQELTLKLETDISAN